MANKETLKVNISKFRLFEVLKIRNSSIRKLGEAYNEIGRTEKTIRRSIEKGKISPELLDNIARFLNIHPDYISGELDKKAQRIKDPYLRQRFLSRVIPKNYPYILKTRSDLSYPDYFDSILAMNLISSSQFQALNPHERILLRQELTVAILEVLSRHFKTDAIGRSIEDDLDYYTSNIGDFDPFSYFAELEDVGISDDEVVFSDWDKMTEEEIQLHKKYFK